MVEATIGIYEKALPVLTDWTARLNAAARAGFDFVEIAVDESPERLARLDWSVNQRRELRNAIQISGIRIQTIILSAHRRFPLGSASVEGRQKAIEILNKAVDFACDIGARTIQLAGYFVYFEEHTAQSRDWFLEGLGKGLERAAAAGVMLGLETMDGEDVTSVRDALKVIKTFNSPWLQVYPDVGNLAANGLDVGAELVLAKGHLIGIHLKDTRPGEFRRVPFGRGNVPFVDTFRSLDAIRYTGNFLIEMWNDGEEDPLTIISDARTWILARMQEAQNNK